MASEGWSYSEDWNNVDGCPIGELTVEEAAARHEKGELYFAAKPLSDGEMSTVVVAVRLESDFASVTYLDELRREVLEYGFTAIEERLFLESIVARDYGDSDTSGEEAEPISIESADFKPDGTVRHEVDESDSDTTEVEEASDVDVSSHWEPIPAFGDYESISRRDRDS